jgi:hypothetical protein
MQPDQGIDAARKHQRQQAAEAGQQYAPAMLKRVGEHDLTVYPTASLAEYRLDGIVGRR